ncbi:putative ribonuclease H-like domain-containing protein [Tanacetum coccineum]
MVPRTVLTRSGLISLNTARPVNTVQPRTAVNNAGPMKNVINNAYSAARRPLNKITSANNSNFTKKVNTVKGTRVNTARSKAVLSAVKGNKGNVVKASTCWVWRPKHKVLDHGNPYQDLKDKGVIDNGCSRHMTGNKSYLTDYEEIDEGFVAFGGNSKGGKITGKDPRNEDSEVPSIEEPRVNQEKDDNVSSTNNVNTASDGNNTNNVNDVSSTVNAADIEVNAVDPKSSIELPDDPNIPELEDIVYSDDVDVGAEADMNNLDAFMPVSPILTTRIHKDHPVEQIIVDLHPAPQPRRMTKDLEEHEEPKKVIHALKDPSWIEAMQDELLQFKLQKMYVKSAFLYGKIEEEVYVFQPPGFEDPDFPDRRGKIDKTLFIRRDKGDILLVQVYVDDIIFGSIKKSLCTEFEKMMHKKFQVSSIGELTFFLGLQVKQKEDRIFISQDKYVIKILKKFGFSDVKTASTPMETHKPLLKDADEKK